MKKIFTTFLFITLVATVAYSQDENTKVTATIQARDCEYIGMYIAHNADFEDLFDAMKAKFRVTNPPTGTTNVTIDTITIKQWLMIDQLLRRDPYAIGGSVWSRVNTALLNVGNSFMTGRLNTQQAEDTNVFTNNRLLGRARLRKE